MTVYVDDMEAPYRGMVMCHLVADTTEELLEMADRIGVARKWIQKPGTPWEHFDVSKGKRALAVAAGAVEVTSRELVGIRRAKRDRAATIRCQHCGSTRGQLETCPHCGMGEL